MKKLRLSFSPLALIVGTIVLFSSCKKINEATELGGGLVPEVDNVNTFETSFETITNNLLLNDTSKLAYSDPVALGHISNDPEFGQTTANVYFSISALNYGTYPFSSKENLEIDSVVLSLSYISSYGDVAALQTVRVYELPQSSSFVDTTLYKFTHPEFETGNELGSKSFAINTLDDSIRQINYSPRDTAKTANVLRIHLDNDLGYRFALLDTNNTALGGFRNDSIFKRNFKGLAIKAESGTGNGLAYFNLSDAAKTNVTVYYRATRGTIKDSGQVVFTHSRNGQANTISRTPAGNYATNVSNGADADELLYIQSTPGSYATVKIPSLDTFSNNVIHRAELIVTRVPSTLDNIFTPPAQLFLNKVNNAGDSAWTFDKDFPIIPNQPLSWEPFGGNLKSDGTYRFNITGHVQDIITRDSSNRTLRLYAPLETTLSSAFTSNATIPVNQRPAEGRVVVGGGTNLDPVVRMRLRIVYSKL